MHCKNFLSIFDARNISIFDSEMFRKISIVDKRKISTHLEGYFGEYIRLGLKQKSGIKGPLPNDIAPREDVIWYKILSFCSEEPKALLSDAVKELLNSQWRKQSK